VNQDILYAVDENVTESREARKCCTGVGERESGK
jgi:hypothetical protein